MTAVVHYKSKKELKARVGHELQWTETSMFGSEYPPNGTGKMYVVGPDEHSRKYFACVHLHDHKVVLVK
jgi:hypothetical protein